MNWCSVLDSYLVIEMTQMKLKESVHMQLLMY